MTPRATSSAESASRSHCSRIQCGDATCSTARTATASRSSTAAAASRPATKQREDFERLIEDIEAGRGDVLVVWEISRKERDLAVYVKICDLCLRAGLNFWMVGGNLYDLRNKSDRWWRTKR